MTTSPGDKLQFSTILMHADDDFVGPGAEPVAPNISVTTSTTSRSALPTSFGLRLTFSIEVFKHLEYQGQFPL